MLLCPLLLPLLSLPIPLFQAAYLHDFYPESRFLLCFLLLPLPFLADSSLSNSISP